MKKEKSKVKTPPKPRLGRFLEGELKETVLLGHITYIEYLQFLLYTSPLSCFVPL